ncbi:MAG: phytanoyl-CoA dioxygenase family protein [Proteobacteria bacterium]|nr:phytanoyl-CoA dioxygenase family protein [Pseudomonadota bacterium]
MSTKPPVPLIDRVELASQPWRAEAQGFLERRLRQPDVQLYGARYSICRVLENAPPHLGLAGNRATLTISIDGNGVRVSEEETPGVDRTESADYNQALAVVTTVSAGEPSNLERAHRELAYRHGAGSWRVAGDPPSSPVIRELLSDLHDHMARRTVTNPDLDHRIRHLGLEANRAQLDEQGYTILRNAVSHEYADEVCAALNKAVDETRGVGAHGVGTGRDGAVGNLLVRGRVFEETAQHPWVLALQDHVVGKGCLLSITTGIRKGPGDNTHVVHIDYPLIEEPLPHYSLNCTSIWALEDFDEISGPTAVIPASHRRYNRTPVPNENAHELIPVLMPKGSIALWRGNLWHSALVRTKPGRRVTLHQSYSRIYVRTLDWYRDIDPRILERNGPALTTLCGLDDVFEKSTDAGPYAEGITYARRNYVLQHVPTRGAKK